MAEAPDEESSSATRDATPWNEAESASFVNVDETESLCGAIQDDSDDEGNTFYFESDHLALKGNKDYQNLLRTLAMLEAQRSKAIQDIDTLLDIRAQALRDPICFVEKLQRGDDLGIPRPQKIATIPNIHWENYTSDIDPVSLGLHKHHTRTKQQAIDNFVTSDNKDIPTCSSINESQELIRGRVKTENKPETFNKLWSAEEQQRLEDLLIKFPPEDVEANRWQKISTALGNRSVHQVASRVQKYFIKLAKAGLPIPGRMPNVHTHRYKTNTIHRHHRHHKFYYQPSTFMQKYEPPVYMSDDEDTISYGGGSVTSGDSQFLGNNEDTPNISDDDTIPSELKHTDEYLELMELKRCRRERIQESTGSMQHVGYKCDRCHCEPIIGVRFHCIDCHPECPVDLCDNCIDSNFENLVHTLSHRLEPIKDAISTSSYIDKDYGYKHYTPSSYNYLDTNYMPAT